MNIEVEYQQGYGLEELTTYATKEKVELLFAPF